MGIISGNCILYKLNELFNRDWKFQHWEPSRLDWNNSTISNTSENFRYINTCRHHTVWTLLHNQTNQTNCWKKWNFLDFLRKIQISIDDSLCLIIICSHFVSIKSRKIRVFSKLAKNPVILPYKYLYLILLITKKPGHI